MNEERFSKEAPIDEYTVKLVDLAKDMAQAAMQSGKKYIIGGGFAIDFSKGKLSRNHHDIDFHPMLEDTSWWTDWFQQKGFVVKKIEGSDYPETYKVEDSEEEEIIDLWPLKLVEDRLVINHKGEYVDSGKYLTETSVVNFQGVNITIENPLRVLEQKTRHAAQGQDLRPQDVHDFELLGPQTSK